MVRRHLVALAAFLVQPHPPALALGVVVLDLHGDHGADPGEGVGHDADQRAVAQADEGRAVDAFDQPAGLLFGQHRGLAAAHDVLGPADRMRRIDGEDLADDQPVEQHADRRKVQFTVGLAAVVCNTSTLAATWNRLEVREHTDLAVGSASARLPVRLIPKILPDVYGLWDLARARRANRIVNRRLTGQVHDKIPNGENMTRPRAADDFAVIRARIEELRREDVPAAWESAPASRGPGPYHTVSAASAESQGPSPARYPAEILPLAGCGNRAVYRVFWLDLPEGQGWRSPVDRICGDPVRSEVWPRQRG